MENLTKLLQQLAEQLGTTSEYLWKILIIQSSISAMISLIYLILTIIGSIILFKIHKKLMKKDKHGNSTYYNLEEGAVIPMILAIFGWIIMFIISMLSISNIINGFFNSEYWALNEILELL